MPPPPKGRLRCGPVTKKIKITPCPPCLGEALKRGTFEYSTDFYGLDVIRIDSYLFLQSHSPDPISKFYTLRAGTGCSAL